MEGDLQREHSQAERDERPELARVDGHPFERMPHDETAQLRSGEGAPINDEHARVHEHGEICECEQKRREESREHRAPRKAQCEQRNGAEDRGAEN